MRCIVKQLTTGNRRRRWHNSCLPLLAGCLFTGLLGSLCLAQTQSSSNGLSESQPQKVPAETSPDSLRQEIKRLRQQAAELRRQSLIINDSAQKKDNSTTNNPITNADYYPVTPERKKDTVQLLSKETTESFLESIRGRKRSTRERGYGGAFGPALSVYAIGMEPVNELIRFMNNNTDFSNATINTKNSFARFQCSGFTGYGAVGNGLRIGGSYMKGSRSYTTFFNDTTFNLEITPSFGGLLLEKALVIENTNLYFGGTFGGGNIRVRPTKSTNALTLIAAESNKNRTNFNELNAHSFLLEVHGGFTYTMINWFHIGADLSAPLFFSQSGFVTSGDHSITNGFISINPGIRIRIMIGNIG